MSAVAARAPVAWQRVLLAPWQQRRNQGPVWFWYALVIGLCLVAAGFSLLPKVSVAWAFSALAGVLAGGGWIWLVAGLIAQNEPHAAHLLPAHVRTLRRVLVCVGAAITVVAAAIGWGIGHTSAVHNPTAVALFVAVGAALTLLIVAWLVRLPQLGLFFWIIPATNAGWRKSSALDAAGRSIATAAHAEPNLVAAGAAALLVAAVAASLPLLIQAGGPRHQRSYRARQRMSALLNAGRADRADQMRWANDGWLGGALRNMSTALYRHQLARAATRREGSVLGRAFVGLGAQLHWSGQLSAALTISVGIPLLWWGWRFAMPRSVSAQVNAMWPIAISVLSVVVGVGLAARVALYRTRREQGLLMLLPGMPRGAALNRELGWRLLAQFVGLWSFGLGVCALMLPADRSQLGWLSILGFACLPLVALLWRDWSTLRAPTPMSGVFPVLFAMLVAGVVIALQLVLEAPPPIWLFALGATLLTALLLAWRWRVVLAAPSAFPAGRRA